MEDLEEERTLVIESSFCYGITDEHSEHYDDSNFFGDSLPLYPISKITCISKYNTGILGLKLTHRNIETKETIVSINTEVKGKGTEQEFEFNTNEFITSVKIYKKEAISGFEITTNQNRHQLFGESKNDMIELTEFSNNKYYILGMFAIQGSNKKENFVSALGFYYMEKKNYNFYLYVALFHFRAKLHNNNSIFKEEAKKKAEKLKKEGEIGLAAVYKTCLLSKNVFFTIIPYLFDIERKK